jgi:sec-independent protein translocase protein TatB
MLDVAWPELIVVGVVALVAIGPKDLPKVMYQLGKWAGKARAVATDMRRAVEQASYEAEIAEKLKNQPTAPPPDKPHDAG